MASRIFSAFAGMIARRKRSQRIDEMELLRIVVMGDE
jgi:hypothetical protein